MLKKRPNSHAVKFAEDVHGTVESFHKLTIVIYNYGSSPMLIWWTGRQKHCTKKLQFIRENAREVTKERLKQEHLESLKFRAGLRRLHQLCSPAHPDRAFT